MLVPCQSKINRRLVPQFDILVLKLRSQFHQSDNIGVFIAGDLVSLYLVCALVGIPAYGLFAFSKDTEQKRSGAIYLALAILGGALLLLAFASC